MPVLLLRSCRVSQELDYPKLIRDVYRIWNPIWINTIPALLSKYKGMWPELYKHICKKYKVPVLPLSLSPLSKDERSFVRQRVKQLASKSKFVCQMPLERRGLVSKAKPRQNPSGKPVQTSELQRPPKRARLASGDQRPLAPRTIAQGTAADCLVRCVEHGQLRKLGHCRTVKFVQGGMTHHCSSDKRCKVTDSVGLQHSVRP